jgi:hypothetical protein
MSDATQALARRLVVGRNGDGRAVYDETVKAGCMAACGRTGASLSRLSRVRNQRRSDQCRQKLAVLLRTQYFVTPHTGSSR